MQAEERDDLISKIHVMVGQVHKTVFGNGTPGLKTRMDRLEMSHEMYEKERAGAPQRAGNWIAICAIVMASLASAASLGLSIIIMRGG